MAIGGDLIEITVNHPVLGTRRFFPKSAEDSTLDPGGFRDTDDANMITGSGEAIRQKNRVRWSLEATIAYDANERDDAAFIADLSASPIEGDWTVSVINGVVYGGKGLPVGDIQPNLNAATMTLKVSGSGVMKKIVG
jgi:hypothetical protein